MRHSAQSAEVPPALRKWFVVHFAADMLFGIPLLFFPEWLLGLFGWEVIDPFTARLVGAALMAIGLESLLGRTASIPSFLTMLRLKIVWSATAVIGIGLTMFEGAPLTGWLIFAIFAAFHLLWVYWFVRMRRTNAPDVN